MSWNRLLGHMIKSGSLLSANQPSCHPVKQTLNRFFGCLPWAACQPDMWTFTKKGYPALHSSLFLLCHLLPSSLVSVFPPIPSPHPPFYSSVLSFFSVFFPLLSPLSVQSTSFPPPSVNFVFNPFLPSSDKVVPLPGWDQSPLLNGVASWWE